MFGKNPKRPPVKGDGQALDIQEIFPTFQGEGVYTGWPAVFIRLGGCNLACNFCDTEFETFREMALEAILAEVEMGMAGYNKLVVITGGEPFRQNIAPLCDALLAKGVKVQIECNGTLFREIPSGVDIICSPKNIGHGYQPIREDLLARITALKFIISASDMAYNQVAELGQTVYNVPVYVQPMDEYDTIKNQANQARALEIAREMGYRVSLQVHKVLGVA